MNVLTKTIAAAVIAAAGSAVIASSAQAQYLPRAPNYYKQQETAAAARKNFQFRAYGSEQEGWYDLSQGGYYGDEAAPQFYSEY